MTRQHKLLFLGILGLLPCFACFSPSEGERTSTGECPSGEVCSTTTAGLFFTGSLDLGDGTHHVGAVTVGGTERVGLLVGDTLETATPFTMPITAASDTPSVLVVDATETGAVTIRGIAEGHAFLRILEADTGHLVDRVQVEVFASEGAQLHATSLDDIGGPRALGGGYLGDFAVLAGTRNELGVTLDGGRTNTGVDRDMEVTDATGTVLVSGLSIAPYHFTLASSSGAPIALALHGAGIDGHVSIPVVDAIDGVHIESHESTDFVSGANEIRVCAYGTAGGLPVVGAARPTFDVGEGAHQTTGSTTHCALLSIAPGISATVSAEIDGQVATTTVTGR